MVMWPLTVWVESTTTIWVDTDDFDPDATPETVAAALTASGEWSEYMSGDADVYKSEVEYDPWTTTTNLQYGPRPPCQITGCTRESVTASGERICSRHWTSVWGELMNTVIDTL